MNILSPRDLFCPEFAWARVQKVQEFISAMISSWAEVILFKSGQEAETECVHKCQKLKWPDIEVVRGQSCQRSKRPEVEMARGRSGQRLKWPGDERARGRSGQRHGVMKGDVNIGGSFR